MGEDFFILVTALAKISIELVPDLNKDVDKQSFWKELP